MEKLFIIIGFITINGLPVANQNIIVYTDDNYYLGEAKSNTDGKFQVNILKQCNFQNINNINIVANVKNDSILASLKETIVYTRQDSLNINFNINSDSLSHIKFINSSLKTLNFNLTNKNGWGLASICTYSCCHNISFYSYTLPPFSSLNLLMSKSDYIIDYRYSTKRKTEINNNKYKWKHYNFSISKRNEILDMKKTK
jgi:hypothetical protein